MQERVGMTSDGKCKRFYIGQLRPGTDIREGVGINVTAEGGTFDYY